MALTPRVSSPPPAPRCLPFRSSRAAAWALAALLMAPAAEAQFRAADDPTCAELRPKVAFLNYFWHKEKQFACYRVKPRGRAIDSSDTGWNGYYHRRFQRLQSHGVDLLGFVFTGFASDDDDIAGEPPNTLFDGTNLSEAIWLARDVGLPFFIYYDTKVRTAIKSHRCRVPDPARAQCPNPKHRPLRNFNLRDPVLYQQLRDDLLRIKDDYILPHRDSYYMLEDESGRRILDARGLPRPVLAIYIARNLVGNRKLARLVREVTAAYQSDGLGQPAFVLDVIWWYDREDEGEQGCTAVADEEVVFPRVVRRFGSAAAALTSFFPGGKTRGRLCDVEWMRDWRQPFGELYGEAARQAAADRRLDHLQIWPGGTAMFDNRRRAKRACERDEVATAFYHLESAEDWRGMLRTLYDSAAVPTGGACPAGTAPTDPPAPQTVVIAYDNEFRESAVIDCAVSGEPDYPYRYGCELLEVVRDEDRSP